jgi:hypothetical protein
VSNKGKDYEKKVFRLCDQRGCIFPGTSNAGGGSGADICLIHNNKPLNIECKYAGADWGQESLKYSNHKWSWTNDDATTQYYESINMIEKINKDFVPYNAPQANMTSSQWTKEKEKIIGVNEKNHDQKGIEKAHIPLDFLEPLVKFYNSKNCYYLQLSKHGLYHLGKDKYELGTPEFDGTIDFRFRAKMHDNFSRRLQGPSTSKDGKKKSNGREESKIKILTQFLFSGIDNVTVEKISNKAYFRQTSSHFDDSIFAVEKNNVLLSIKSYEELFKLVNETTGKDECEKGTQLKITKYLDRNDPATFTIKPTPWNYSFFGIMKLEESPTVSPLSLDPLKSQSFPDINF